MILARYIFTAYMVTNRAHHRIVGEKMWEKSNRLKFPKNLDFNAFECFFLPKVFCVFQNWTKKMSKNRYGRKKTRKKLKKSHQSIML